MPLHVRHAASALPPGTAACIGAFDGLHLGHRALLARARALAPRVAVVTFDPHPQKVLTPDRPPQLLLHPGQRERLLRALGIDDLVLLPFDHAMAAMEPAAFVQTQIVDGLRPTAVVVGEDFRFGAGRRGGVDELAALLEDTEIELEVVPPVPLPAAAREPDGPLGGPLGVQYSRKLGSTQIRAAIAAGAVERAAIMLGRLHAVQGEVVVGDRRGRTIGVPTANLRTTDALVPAPGVYATWLSVPDDPALAEPLPSVANIGTNPTFTSGTAPLRLEVHVLDRDLGESLYGRTVEVSFVARLRDELKFPSVEALVRRIADDIVAARPLLDDASRAQVIPP